MRNTFLIVAVSLGLVGCVSTEQRAANDDASCRQMGAQPGTDVYVQCRMYQQQRYDNQRAARRQALFAAGDSLQGAQIRPTYAPSPTITCRTQPNLGGPSFGSTTTCQ